MANRKVLFALGLLVSVACLQSFTPNTPEPQTQTVNQETMNRGKQVFMQRCLVCHQSDGGGVPRLNPPLDGASNVKGNDKARMIRIVLQGMSERVELDGEVYSNNMTAAPDLTDQQVADVLTYIRNSWSNKASAVTPQEVKAVRAKLK